VKWVRMMAALALAGAASPALAGPPYLTDDPVPTDTGHWEIYGFTAGEGFGSALDMAAGTDLNYGPVKDVQLTATLPLSFAHDETGWQSGTGDVEIGVKYRFFHDEARGLSAAIFPRVILPTSSLASDGKTRFLLPLWIGKDFAGGTSLFGGGGYLINPGAGNRDFWQAAVALTHDVSKEVSVGAEVTRQGPDTVGGTSQTRAGVGTILHLSGPASLLLSGGPTWADHQTGYHFYGALGFNF
jgi:hypothetical protein